MKMLSKEEFLGKKQSDTLLIYGSGRSIRDITEEGKKKLMLFDSISFN